jgi:acetoin utilization deacetylase AcuC-like enzyme
MNTILFSHSACLAHETGSFHPESPDRLRAVLAALEREEFAYLDRREAPRATVEQLSRSHAPSYVMGLLRAIPAEGMRQIDADTVVSSGSGEAALRAAGALVAAVDAVMAGQARNAFCAVRPPGHHAEPGQAMGFCLFNNVGVGAYHARAVHGLKRIAIVDFDVHHGNGSETLAKADPDLFYASTHQAPLYPGTGMDNDPRHPNIVNAFMPPGAGSAEFRADMERNVLPALERFAPQFLFISAGFDAHRDDPLAELNLLDDDYRWATEKLMDVADRHCAGRVVSTLEGGYDLDALARSAAIHVRALMVHKTLS